MALVTTSKKRLKTEIFSPIPKDFGEKKICVYVGMWTCVFKNDSCQPKIYK